MKTLKEFINEDFFSSAINKVVSIADGKDVKKIKQLKGLKRKQLYFKKLDRFKKIDVKNVLMRKYHELDKDMKEFADYLLKIKIR